MCCCIYSLCVYVCMCCCIYSLCVYERFYIAYACCVCWLYVRMLHAYIYTYAITWRDLSHVFTYTYIHMYIHTHNHTTYIHRTEVPFPLWQEQGHSCSLKRIHTHKSRNLHTLKPSYHSLCDKNSDIFADLIVSLLHSKRIPRSMRALSRMSKSMSYLAISSTYLFVFYVYVYAWMYFVCV
jgi:hypothetical protein